MQEVNQLASNALSHPLFKTHCPACGFEFDHNILLVLLNFSRENADGTSVKQLGSNYWDVMVPGLVLRKEEKKSLLLMNMEQI